jgi:cellulose biosynthesis protein BcsQ
MNYEDDIRIDETSLDIEWLEQATLFLRYSKNAALREKEKDQAKEALDLAKSELDRDIRTNPEKYGIEKITDKVVENIIPTQDQYKEASEAFINAKYEWNVAKGAVDAFNQRKEALENLTRLNGQNWFAGPKVPRDLREQREMFQKKINERIGTRIRRNK